MKKLSTLLALAMLLMLAVPAMVLADGHETITDIVVASADAEENPEFTILKAALEEAELTDALAGEGPFTVFAPTDEAFGNLLEELGIEAGDLLGHPQLADVLLYHVVSGTKAMSTDLSDGQEIETMQGENVTIDLTDGVFVNDSEVITEPAELFDIEASNGVIHAIDAVLVPDAFVLETDTITDIVVGLADAEEEFTILKAALVEADLADALAGDGPFTVFAPTDEAFGDLLEELGIEADDLLGHPQLADVLLYHVVSGTKAMSGDLEDGQEIETMQGENVTISLGSVFVNEAEVIDADIGAANGVIHVIDAVLVPDAFVLAADADEDEDAEEEEETAIPPTGDARSTLPAVVLFGLGLGLLIAMGASRAKQKQNH